MKYKYKWNLKTGYPASGVEYHGAKVFSCFACGGGSSMGYKLAGFDVIGCNEIDKKMNDCYVANHNPQFNFLESICDFKNRNDLPKELFELDILDGSPPCSSFSMAGNRGKDWGKNKKFREGQKKQILDTLFFDFIDLAEKLQPKIIIAENVKGLLCGPARKYLQQIIENFEKINYKVTYRLLDASKMGVPQKRERVFFFAIRGDLANDIGYNDMFQIEPILDLIFNDPKIPYSEIEQNNIIQENISHVPSGVLPFLRKIKPGRSCSDVHEKGHYFQEFKLHKDKPLPTLRAGSNSYYHYSQERRLFDVELMLGGSFPLDYNFIKNKPIYIIGMSVPPVMMANIADKIKIQWLDKITLN